MKPVRTTIRNPIKGISLKADVRREQGQVQLVENFRVSKMKSLTRRPPGHHDGVFDEVVFKRVKHFNYTREGIEYKILINEERYIVVYKREYAGSWVYSGKSAGYTGLGSNRLPDYMGDIADLDICNINDAVYIWNKTTKVRLVPYVKWYANQCSFINITGQMAYGDVARLLLTRYSLSPLTGKYTIVQQAITQSVVSMPNFADNNTLDADNTRRPDYVAEQLFLGISGVTGQGWNGIRNLLSPLWKQLSGVNAILKAAVDAAAPTNTAMNSYIDAWISLLRVSGGQNKIDSETLVRESLLEYDLRLLEYLNSYTTWLQDQENAEKRDAQSKLYQAQLEAKADYDAAAANNMAVPAGDAGMYALNYNTFVLGALNAIDADIAALEGVVLANAGENGWLWSDWATPIQDLKNKMINERILATTGNLYSLDSLVNAGFRAERIGTNIAVYAAGNTDDIVQIDIISGRSDGIIKVVNTSTQSIDGLPLYAKAGAIVSVQPDKGGYDRTSASYYLKAMPVIPGTRGICEVIWKETRNPWLPHELDRTTMPVVVYPMLTQMSWDYPANLWEKRRTGDDLSCPRPSFIGKTIKSMSFFQKRLVIVAGNRVSMTESFNISNFWKASAVKLMVSDPVDVSSSATGVDVLQYAVAHNRDLLLMARNAQFKISGSSAVTPETISMMLTANYDVQLGAKPISVGSVVLFPTSYGDSSGINEYVSKGISNQDSASSITNHVVGLIPGVVTHIASSSSSNAVFVRSTGMRRGQICVCEKFTDGDQPVYSWSSWQFDGELIDFYVLSERLYTVVWSAGKIVQREHIFTPDRLTGKASIYLDDFVKLTYNPGTDRYLIPNWLDLSWVFSDGITVKWVAIAEGANEWTPLIGPVPGQLTATEFNCLNQYRGNVWIGRRYESTLVPSRIYRYDENGEARVRDKIGVHRWYVSLSNSWELEFWSDDGNAQYKSNVNKQTWGQANYGVLKHGIAEFVWRGSYDYGQWPVFYASGPYTVTIDEISWVGAFHSLGEPL